MDFGGGGVEECGDGVGSVVWWERLESEVGVVWVWVVIGEVVGYVVEVVIFIV